jgi:hypothetical protein
MVARARESVTCFSCGTAKALCRLHLDDSWLCRPCVERLLHYALTVDDAVRACLWHAKRFPNLHGARVVKDEDGARLRLDLACAYGEMGMISHAVSEALLAALGAETTHSIELALDALFSAPLARADAHRILDRMAASAHAKTG